jgi:CRP/FNR family cyclic AMP-dependent transcriptional regulator
MSDFVPGTFLAALDEEQRASLLEIGVVRPFPRGAALMLQDEPDERVMVLVSGRVKITRVEKDGRELVLELRDPGDLLGELSFIDGAPRVASVITLEPAMVLVMPAGGLRRYLETTPRAAVALLEIVARRLRDSTANRARFAAADTLARVAARILELAERYGEESAAGTRVQSPLSQEDLAAWTGASRAAVAEALRTMRELGWIETKRGSLTIRDLASLRGRAA